LIFGTLISERGGGTVYFSHINNLYNVLFDSKLPARSILSLFCLFCCFPRRRLIANAELIVLFVIK